MFPNAADSNGFRLETAPTDDPRTPFQMGDEICTILANGLQRG
jgi:hypothetical protein